MANPTLNYTNKDFSGIRTELIKTATSFYGDEVQTILDDSSVGSMLLDLCAATGDILSFNTDKALNETQIDYAGEIKNIYQLAKNKGVPLPNKRGSVTICDFTVTVPTLGSSFDPQYCPILKAGTQTIGSGKSFELLDDLDFSSPYSSLGSPNRKIIPNISADGSILSYNITKSEVCYNGITKIYKQTIKESDVKPFMDVYLPDDDVSEIISVIVKTGILSNTPEYSEFFDEDLKYYEVPYLAEQYVFIEDTSEIVENGLKTAKIKKVNKKYIKEFTPNGFCKLTFGSGSESFDSFNQTFTQKGFSSLSSYLKNTALGISIPPNSTLYVKYRTSNGASSNIGANVLTSMGNVYFSISGTRNDFNQTVRKSLTVTNTIPAFGGADKLSIEQIRYLTKYYNATQDRCVTLTDYLVMVYLMPGKFGSPYKVNVIKQDNKVVPIIIGIDANGKLNNTSISLLKRNISVWLAPKRMVNDYIEVRDGKIINLGYNITVLVDDNATTLDLKNQVINAVATYHDVSKMNMGDDIFLGGLIENINNIKNVLNVVELNIFNKVGNGYSLNETTMSYINDETRQINPVDYSLFCESDSIFEIKNPQDDIIVTIKKKQGRFIV
jgi:hypothetical protein